MKLIRNWYQLLDQQGLEAHDSGPGQAHGTLTPDVTWLPYYYPPGTLLGYKGVTIAASESRIVSPAAAGFNAAEGSIEMLVRPGWNNADDITHFFWNTYGGNNRRFYFFKLNNNLTYLSTDTTSRGSFTYPWAAGSLYHIVLNWGTNKLWINGVLEKTYIAGGLGDGASTLYIGDHHSSANNAFSGNIYYFIVRDVPLTLPEIATFKTFFESQYIAPP